MDAHALLTALQATGLPVKGISLGDLSDRTTWRVDGPLTAAQRAQAIGVLQGQVAAPPVSTFWPAALTTLEADVARIKAFLGLGDPV